MLPSRYGACQPSASSSIRKSRLEGKPSLLPKPRRHGSTDRLSSEFRRPSATGRSSSADPPKASFAGSRLSREAASTKQPLHMRSRSQQSDRFGQSSITPLRSSNYARVTTTPRTPSEDRKNPNWEKSLERALAFLTAKDSRPISNVAWQRAEYARVQEALNARGVGGVASLTLIKPLTIARFVDVTGSLLAAITHDTKVINNDNYVTKLPHIAKRLLYPGTLSKSWLKSVNALHAFPQALAFISYLLDLVNEIEKPVTPEWLSAGKDELALLKNEYLRKCWIHFQEPGSTFDEFNEEYLEKLKALLGNDEEKLKNLQQAIKKYELCLEDEAELAARADEARLSERRDGLLAALRAEKGARRQVTLDTEAQLAAKRDKEQRIKQLDAEIERANAELNQLNEEVENQPISVEERSRLRAEVEYANKVLDSKRAVAEQIEKTVSAKEAELAHLQTVVLVSCQEYKQHLFSLSAHFPDIVSLAVDENELMREECLNRVLSAVEALRDKSHQLAEQRASIDRSRNALRRKIHAQVEKTRAALEKRRLQNEREDQLLKAELAKEAGEAAAWVSEQQEIMRKIEEYKVMEEEYAKIKADLHFWQKQKEAWCVKLTEMHEFIRLKREESKQLLDEGRKKRMDSIISYIRDWNSKIP